MQCGNKISTCLNAKQFKRHNLGAQRQTPLQQFCTAFSIPNDYTSFESASQKVLAWYYLNYIDGWECQLISMLSHAMDYSLLSTVSL